MEAAALYEKLVPIYQTAWPHKPEGHTFIYIRNTVNATLSSTEDLDAG
jgi:hypothetical protein